MEKTMKWNVLGTETIIKDPWIDLKADKCVMPDGTVIAPFYVNHLPDFVAVVAITEAREFLMIRQYRHGVQKVILEIPAGCVEPGEEAEAGVRRELLEETGYEAGQLKFLFKIAPNATCLSNYACCYLATGVRKVAEQHLDQTEEIEVLTKSIAEVREALRSGEIEQAVHVAAIYRALDEVCDMN